MTPVMERCECPNHWPVAECDKHAPDTSGLTLDGPPVIVTIAAGAIAVAVVIVAIGIATIAWTLGVVIDTLRGER
jgi:hypothetical protein